MSDLISRKALINKFEQWQKNEEWNLLVDVITEIKNMPLATDTNVATKVGTNLASLGTDCISRQEAINAIDECYCGGEDSCGEPWIYQENAVEAIQMIEPIPPAEPKRGKWIKTARWGRVYYCNQCRNYLDFDGVNAGRGSTNFCPNCGADMRGEQDDSV